MAMLPAMGSDSGWGRDLEEAERVALPRVVRDEITSQETPGVIALVVLSSVFQGYGLTVTSPYLRQRYGEQTPVTSTVTFT
eukprot:4731773-Prymnesium_polylepis.1